MSCALNLLSNPILQGYGPAESSCLPCLGVSGRASMSPCPTRIECKALQVKIASSKCSLRQMSNVCKASSGGQRRNSDFSRQNRHGFSRNRNMHNGERDSSEKFDESEFLSTKNGPLLSLSNSPKSQPTASPGPREREIVELFRKVQAQLRERAAIKEEKKFEVVKGQNKENETVDSLLKLLRKHSVEQGKRRVNGGNPNEFNFDRSRQSEPFNEDKSRSYVNSDNIVREEPQETNKPSFSRPPSNFRRRSPVPRVRYEPIVSAEGTAKSVLHVDVDETTSKSHPEPEPDSEFYSEPDVDMDLVSGLEMEQEELEIESDLETDVEDGQVDNELEDKDDVEDGKADNELEDKDDAKDEERRHTELKDLNAMKLPELKELAKARGMKGFSKLKKSELVGLLSEDSI